MCSPFKTSKKATIKQKHLFCQVYSVALDEEEIVQISWKEDDFLCARHPQGALGPCFCFESLALRFFCVIASFFFRIGDQKGNSRRPSLMFDVHVSWSPAVKLQDSRFDSRRFRLELHLSLPGPGK